MSSFMDQVMAGLGDIQPKEIPTKKPKRENRPTIGDTVPLGVKVRMRALATNKPYDVVRAAR